LGAVLIGDAVVIFGVTPPLTVNNKLVFIPAWFQFQHLLPGTTFEFPQTIVLAYKENSVEGTVFFFTVFFAVFFVLFAFVAIVLCLLHSYN
jgi:hypothetical protein